MRYKGYSILRNVTWLCFCPLRRAVFQHRLGNLREIRRAVAERKKRRRRKKKLPEGNMQTDNNLESQTLRKKRISSQKERGRGKILPVGSQGLIGREREGQVEVRETFIASSPLSRLKF